MVYSVKISKSAQRTIDEQKDSKIVTMLVTTCYSLVKYPDISNVKKLKGRENTWRYRKGDWRFIFTVTHKVVKDKKVSVVIVDEIRQRKDAY